MGQRWYEEQRAASSKRQPVRDTFGTVGKLLVQGGFVVIPVKGKQPVPNGWSGFWQRPPSARTYSKWCKTNADSNVGLCTGEVIAIDIDHDDQALAESTKALVFEVLGPTPFIRVGRVPRLTCLYRLSASDAYQTSSWSQGKVDLLADGKQCVVFGTHPDTGQPFKWLQRTILGVSVKDLPLVSAEALQRLKDRLRGAHEEDDPSSVNGEPAIGHRNNFLFRHGLQEAHFASSKSDLLDRLNERNSSFLPPLSAVEVAKVANTIWRYKEEGTLLSKGRAAPCILPVSRQAGAEIFRRLSPNASKLYLVLIVTRDSREEFRIPQKATAEYMGCGVQTVSNAIKELKAASLVVDLKKAKGGSRNWRGAKLYCFGSGAATGECYVSSILPGRTLERVSGTQR